MTAFEAIRLVLTIGAVGAAILVARMAGPYFVVLADLFRGGPRPPSHPLPADDSPQAQEATQSAES
jgi:hypothetical protein